MYPFIFKKERVEQYLQCLNEGTPLGVVRGASEWMNLAGACLFVLATHGPMLEKARLEAQGRTPSGSDTLEEQEAEEATMTKDLEAAVRFAAHLTTMIYYDEYDELYEPNVHCGIVCGGGDFVHITPVKGFKKPGDLCRTRPTHWAEMSTYGSWGNVSAGDGCE